MLETIEGIALGLGFRTLTPYLYLDTLYLLCNDSRRFAALPELKPMLRPTWTTVCRLLSIRSWPVRSAPKLVREFES
jgi:hypothetical protein